MGKTKTPVDRWAQVVLHGHPLVVGAMEQEDGSFGLSLSASFKDESFFEELQKLSKRLDTSRRFTSLEEALKAADATIEDHGIKERTPWADNFRGFI